MKEKDYQLVMEHLPDLVMHTLHRQWVDHRFILLLSNRQQGQ